MQLKAFRVQKFRNVEDSGEVELLDALTCVVGKNQAGKSALLKALHKFNPHLPEPYDMRREWPRGQRTERNEKQVVCTVRFTLSSEELEKLGEIAGQELSIAEVVVTRNYAGDLEFSFQKIRRSSRTPCINIRLMPSSRACPSDRAGRRKLPKSGGRVH